MKYKASLLKLMTAVESLGFIPNNSKWGRADYGSYVGGDKAKVVYDVIEEIKGVMKEAK